MMWVLRVAASSGHSDVLLPVLEVLQSFPHGIPLLELSCSRETRDTLRFLPSDVGHGVGRPDPMPYDAGGIGDLLP